MIKLLPTILCSTNSKPRHNRKYPDVEKVINKLAGKIDEKQ